MINVAKGKPFLGERNHYILFSAIGFTAGCACFTWFQFGWWVWLWLTLSALLGLLFFFLGKKPTIALLLAFFALGMLRTELSYSYLVPEEGKYEVTGYVCGDVKHNSSCKTTFRLSGITLNGEKISSDAYCTLNSQYLKEENPELFDGALIRFEGKVYLPQGKSGEPHYDLRRWMYENQTPFGISSYTLVSLENTKDTAPVRDLASRIRSAIRERLEASMGERASVAMALLFGDKTGLSDEEYQSFQTLGIAHLMSVSGLHIGILAGLLMKLLSALKLKRTLRYPIVVIFLFAYSALCGFSPASLRAAIMFSLLQLAELFFRARDHLTILSLAAFLILLINPIDATSAGFILSFTAMLGIYGITPSIQDCWNKIWPVPPLKGGNDRKNMIRRFFRKVQSGFQSGFSLSLGAQLGALLPTVCFFHQLPTYGLIVNLIMVPFVGSLMTPYLFLTALFSFVPGLSYVLGLGGKTLADLLLSCVSLLSDLPGALIRVATPNRFLLIGIVLATLLLTRLIPGSIRSKLIAAACALVVGVGLSFADAPASLRYYQLSVGQADSAVIMDGNQTIVIDTGEDGDELVDYLLTEGRNVDVLIITHLHNDHFGGVQALLERQIKISKLYLPCDYAIQDNDNGASELLALIRENNIPITELAEGDVLQFNQCEIRVLWPKAGEVRQDTDANNGSLALYIRLGDYSILNMADLGEDYEEYTALPANVLKVAHHGSAKASQEVFLQTVQPDCAIISCSSSRQLPASSTVERIAEQNIPMLRTDESGDILIVPGENSLSIEPYRGGVLH